MRYLFALLAFLLTLSSAKAQELPLENFKNETMLGTAEKVVLDYKVHRAFRDGVYMKGNPIYYEYDDRGNMIEEYSHYENGNLIFRNKFEYNEKNQIIRTYQSKEDYPYTLYGYDDNGYLIREMIQSKYHADFWYNIDSLVYYNDVRGNPIRIYRFIRTLWDEKWKLIRKRINKFDSYNNNTLFIDSVVTAEGKWKFYRTLKTNYAYLDDKKTVEIDYYWNDNVWKPVMKYTYKYNDNSLMINEKFYSMRDDKWVLGVQLDYIYEDRLLKEDIHFEFRTSVPDSAIIKSKNEYHYKTILDVEANYSDLSFELSPNPINNHININILNSRDLAYASLEIHDILGNQVQVLNSDILLNLGNNHFAYNINLNSGMYYLILRTEHTIALRKLIVMR